MKFLLEKEKLSLIKRIELEATKIPGVVSLAQWIPWYHIPNKIIEFVIEKIKNWYTNRYSIVPWLLELREHLSLAYLQKYNIEIDYEKEIIINAGAIQWITAVLLTILNNEKNEVILIDPSYASYQTSIKVARWNYIFSELDENLDLDLEDISWKITDKTKAILLCNPNNPTGSIFSWNKIEQLCQIASKKNIYVLLDEVYDEFVYVDNVFKSWVYLYSKYKDNLIILNSWSKSYGMTGWRIWFTICNSRLFEEILKVHDSMITCAPVHSQYAALATFEISDSWFKKINKELIDRRNYTIQRLKKLSDFLEFKEPQATYYVFPKFKYTNDDYKECLNILHKQKVAFVPWSWFWHRGKWHFRICFGRDWEDLKEWMDRLERYFSWK